MSARPLPLPTPSVSAWAWTVVAAILVSACAPAPSKPTAVVLLIGDGMGSAHIALARQALHGVGSQGRLALESMPHVGLVSTWSSSNAVTDSAAAATAFASGVKTINKRLGLDSSGRRARTITDLAKAVEWNVGYVTTMRVTHATPAAFYAAHLSRYDECAIAAQMFEQAPEVVLGGGRRWFEPRNNTCPRTDPEDADLLARAREQGYEIWTKGEDLNKPAPDRLLGLFAPSNFRYQIDQQTLGSADRDPSLSRLTRLALETLARDNASFFLLVEGGLIDYAAHAFDAAGVIAEMAAFDEAVREVLTFSQQRRGATLVLATADHATGGLTLTESIDWEGLRRQYASTEIMVEGLCGQQSAPNGPADLERWTGYTDWSDSDVTWICGAAHVNEKRRRLGRALAARNGVTWMAFDFEALEPDIVHTQGHTGEDVPLYATGPGAERFAGTLDNTEIAKRLADLLGWGSLPRFDAAGPSDE